MPDTTKRGPGRPPGVTMRKRTLAIDDARWAWLTDQHDNASAAVRDLIDAEMRRQDAVAATATPPSAEGR